MPSTLDPASAVPPRTACTTSPLDNPCSAKSGGQRKDETSRNIGSLAFPCKRADHPEVSRSEATCGQSRRQTVQKIRFPPNVDNCVETMCTVRSRCGEVVDTDSRKIGQRPHAF